MSSLILKSEITRIKISTNLILSSFTMTVKYQWVLSGLLPRIFSDRWSMKVFTKTKLVFSSNLFGNWSHILVLLGILVYILSGTFYLDRRTILLDGRLLFFSIIVKILNFYSCCDPLAWGCFSLSENEQQMPTQRKRASFYFSWHAFVHFS